MHTLALILFPCPISSAPEAAIASGRLIASPLTLALSTVFLLPLALDEAEVDFPSSRPLPFALAGVARFFFAWDALLAAGVGVRAGSDWEATEPGWMGGEPSGPKLSCADEAEDGPATALPEESPPWS